METMRAFLYISLQGIIFKWGEMIKYLEYSGHKQSRIQVPGLSAGMKGTVTHYVRLTLSWQPISKKSPHWSPPAGLVSKHWQGLVLPFNWNYTVAWRTKDIFRRQSIPSFLSSLKFPNWESSSIKLHSTGIGETVRSMYKNKKSSSFWLFPYFSSTTNT